MDVARRTGVAAVAVSAVAGAGRVALLLAARRPHPRRHRRRRRRLRRRLAPPQGPLNEF